MWLDSLVFCDYGFNVSAFWCPLATPTILLGFLLPWTWGMSSRLLQQSTAAAPYLGRGVSPHSCPSWPWMWSSYSRPSCACAAPVMPALCNPIDGSLPVCSVLGDSPSKNTRVCCLALFQRIFPSQIWSPSLQHCRWILYQLGHKGVKRKLSDSAILRTMKLEFSRPEYWSG